MLAQARQTVGLRLFLFRPDAIQRISLPRLREHSSHCNLPRIMRTLLPLIILFVFMPAYAAQPCTKATAECTRWLGLGGEARSLIYSTYPLDKKNDQIVRALIVVHGQGRDADNYFRTSLAAAFLANAMTDTIVISPRFASSDGGCHDALAANEVSWPCGGDSWRSGGTSTNHKSLTSYDFMDAIVRALTNKANFPNLKAIVISGHSAGGQFVTRSEEHTAEL